METRDINTFNRMDINGETNCFFIKKDNNEDFMSIPNSPSDQSAKKEHGRISKAIFDESDSNLCKSSKTR